VIITSITKQKKSKRYNIFLDGEFSFGVSETVLTQFHLQEGQTIFQELISKIQDEELWTVTKLYVLRLLARTMRTEFEIRNKLKKRNITEEMISRMITWLYEHKFLNDEHYSQTFVTSKLHRKHTSKKLLQQQLRTKGIPSQIINTSLKAITGEIEIGNAMLIAEKKVNQLSNSHRVATLEMRRRRVGEFLVRKGFSYDIVKKVLRKYFSVSEYPQYDDESNLR